MIVGAKMYGLSGGVKPFDVIIISGVAKDKKKKFTVNLITNNGHVRVNDIAFYLRL